MSSFELMRTGFTIDRADIGRTGLTTALFGLAAAIFFVSWVSASILDKANFSDPLFCAFSLSIMVAMGLSERRSLRTRQSVRVWLRQAQGK